MYKWDRTPGDDLMAVDEANLEALNRHYLGLRVFPRLKVMRQGEGGARKEE